MLPPTSRINNATLHITYWIRLSLDYHYLETKRSHDSIKLLPLLSWDRTLPCLFKIHVWAATGRVESSWASYTCISFLQQILKYTQLSKRMMDLYKLTRVRPNGVSKNGASLKHHNKKIKKSSYWWSAHLTMLITWRKWEVDLHDLHKM